MKTLSLFLFAFLVSISSMADSWLESFLYEARNQGKSVNFYDVQKAFYEQQKNYVPLRGENENEYEEEHGMPGSLEFGRWEEFMEPRVFPTGDLSLPARAAENYSSFMDSKSHGRLFRNALPADVSNHTVGNWQSLGPAIVTAPGPVATHGRIDFVRFDPANSTIMFAGSYTGGLWKSVNSGSNWTHMTDNLPFIGCYDLAISNSNSDKMYLATGSVGGAGYIYGVSILKTLDGGLTWSNTNIPLPVHMYEGVKKIKVHPTDDNIVLAATFDGIYRTSDGGTSWTKIQAGSFIDITFKPGDPTIVYATQIGSGTVRFYRSTDTGLIFNHITSGLQTHAASATAFKIGVTPANPDYVYIVAMDNSTRGFNGIYRSIDAGVNFNTQTDSSGFMRLLYNPDFMCITINPTNAEDVYIGGFAPYHSTDGGVNWVGSGGLLYVDLHALEFLPGSSTTIFAACDGGLSKSIANGSNWTYLSNGLQITQMYKMANCSYNSNKVMTGQQDVGVHTYNAGTWSNLYQFDGMDSYFDPVDTNTLYISGQYGLVLKSTDAGVNFNIIVSSYGSSGLTAHGNWTSPFIMSPSDHNTLFIGKDSVYRSIDAGQTWQSMQGSYSLIWKYSAIACAPSNANYIYAATRSVFYACTNGNSFTSRSATFPGAITSIAVSNVNPEKVWITLSGYNTGNKVYVSSDAGLTWTDYSDGLPNLPVNCIVYHNNSNDKLYVGMDVGVYFRDAAMPFWESFSSGLPNVQIREMEIQYSVNKLRAATFGRGLWESEIDLSTGITQISLDDDFLLYPNPTTGKFYIKFKDDFNKYRSIKFDLFNSVGECVNSQHIDEESTEINLNLSSGLYFARIKLDEREFAKKIVVE